MASTSSPEHAADATTTTTTNIIAGLSREELEGELHDSHHREELLEQRLLSVEGELRVLRRNNDGNQHRRQSQSLFSELILLFLAGFIGFAPPLFVDIDAVLGWTGWRVYPLFGCSLWKNRSGDDGATGGNPPSPTEAVQEEEEEEQHGSESDGDNERNGPLKTFLRRIRTNLRLPFYAAVSLLDFADAIVDMIVSVRAVLEDCSEEDGDRVVKSWGLVLFSGTIVARLLGGLFGVVYHQIGDKTDREISYFLVEIAIFLMEDAAAIFYIHTKRARVGGYDKLDAISEILTFICAIAFAVPTFCQYKRLLKRLSRCARLVFAGCALFFFFTISDRILRTTMYLRYQQWLDQNQEMYFTIVYSMLNASLLYVLFSWSRSLCQNDQSRTAARPSQQTQQFADPSFPTGDELAP